MSSAVQERYPSVFLFLFLNHNSMMGDRQKASEFLSTIHKKRQPSPHAHGTSPAAEFTPLAFTGFQAALDEEIGLSLLAQFTVLQLHR